MNVFDRIVEWMDSGEHSFVTFLSKVIPFIVPLIPAYVGYLHVVNELGFGRFFGFTYGVVIEGLGYSAIFKAVQFWENNRHYTKKENQSPLFVAIFIYLVYLSVILTVNVLLDWEAGVSWWKVLAVGLISILSVPAGLLMSISAVHTERVLQRENERQERRERKSEHRTANIPFHQTRRTNTERTPNERSDDGSFAVRKKIAEYVLSVQQNEQRTPGPSEISRSVGVSKSYASDTLRIILETQSQQNKGDIVQ